MKKINLQNWLQFPKWMFGQWTKQFGRRNNPLHALNQRAPDEGNRKSPQFPGPLHRRSSRGLSPYRRFLLWFWARRCEQRELIHSRNERQETRLVPQGLCSGTLDTLPPVRALPNLLSNCMPTISRSARLLIMKLIRHWRRYNVSCG